jgi:TPR repeat protein
MYLFGEGVPQDYAEAVKWYRKVAEQGDDVAQFKLGQMYEEGKGVQKDMTEATKWIRKAAEQGHEYAKEWLEKNSKDKSE